MELSSLVSQYLIRLTVLMDAILQQMDGMFPRRVVMNLAAWNESAVVIQVTDHPFIVYGHLEVCLP